MSKRRSISDDDICSECATCIYRPGGESECLDGWPGHVDIGGPRKGYVTSCEDFFPITFPGTNLSEE